MKTPRMECWMVAWSLGVQSTITSAIQPWKLTVFSCPNNKSFFPAHPSCLFHIFAQFLTFSSIFFFLRFASIFSRHGSFLGCSWKRHLFAGYAWPSTSTYSLPEALNTTSWWSPHSDLIVATMNTFRSTQGSHHKTLDSFLSQDQVNSRWTFLHQIT